MIDSESLKKASAKVARVKLLYLLDEFKKIPELSGSDHRNIDELKKCIESFDLELNHQLRFTWFQGKHILNKYIGRTQDLNDGFLYNLNLDSNEPNRLCQLWIYQLILILPYISHSKNNLSGTFYLENMKGVYPIEISPSLRLDIHIQKKEDLQLGFSAEGIIVELKSTRQTYRRTWDNLEELTFFKPFHKNTFCFQEHTFALPFSQYSYALGNFVETSIIRSENYVETFSKQLKDAFYILNELGFEDVFNYFNAILPFYTYKNYHNSSSPEEIMGLILVPSPNANFQNGNEILAECILHEGLHNKLYLLEESTRFYADKSHLDEIYLSPWRREPRPIRMIIHGCFVFTSIADFWLKLLHKNTADKNILFHVVLRLNQVEFGLNTIKKFANLDAVGIMVINELIDTSSRIRSSLGGFDIKDAETSVIDSLQKHAREFNYLH